MLLTVTGPANGKGYWQGRCYFTSSIFLPVCTAAQLCISQCLFVFRLSPKDVTDWIQFMMDIFHTINIFILVHSPSCLVFQSKQFAQRLAGYYDGMIPVLQEKWRLLKNIIPHDKWFYCTGEYLYITVSRWVMLKLNLRATKKNMVSIIYQLLAHCYVDAQVTAEETSGNVLR